MLAGEIAASARTGTDDGDAARLAAEDRLALEDVDLKPAFYEFVRGAKPGHTSSENRHRIRHHGILHESPPGVVPC